MKKQLLNLAIIALTLGSFGSVKAGHDEDLIIAGTGFGTIVAGLGLEAYSIAKDEKAIEYSWNRIVATDATEKAHFQNLAQKAAQTSTRMSRYGRIGMAAGFAMFAYAIPPAPLLKSMNKLNKRMITPDVETYRGGY